MDLSGNHTNRHPVCRLEPVARKAILRTSGGGDRPHPAHPKAVDDQMTDKRRCIGGNRWTALLLFVVIAVVLRISSHDFLAMWVDPPIYPGPGVTRVIKLSTYSAGLAGTAGDTNVYFLEGDEEGGTVLLMGGSSPDEPAGLLAAVTVIENAAVKRGRIIVVPRANRSAFTTSEPMEGYPQTFFIETPGGTREFRHGSRWTNPIHQWPDPLVYHAEGQALAGKEARNLNRTFPGNKHGNLTERIAYALTRLIVEEEVDIVIDLHEASPEYPVVNAIVAHDRAMKIAVEASLFLEFEGIQIIAERSPANLRGLTHREWGDTTEALPFLLETANPAQGRLRGRVDAARIISGTDLFYVRAAEHGLLFVPFCERGHPLKERVGRHLQTFSMLVDVFSRHYPERAVIAVGIPNLEQMLRDGLGAHISPPQS